MVTSSLRKDSEKGFAEKDGNFKRLDSSFRNTLSKNSKFAPEAGRYHLYVSLACPWAHRVLIARALKGLTSIISVSVVHWHMDSKGWRFPTKEEIAESDSVGTPDHVNSYSRLSELYFSVEKDYPGRFTVPVLYDKQTKQIVNNESSEILRIFNSDFNSILPDSHAKIDLYPSKLKSEIDELNAWVYDNINNGVYKAGFAGTQEVYEKEAKNVFNYLDKVETILKKNHESNQDYLIGNDLTEADIRLFTTIVRFDPVYVQHFKVNQGTIRDNYPNINKWLKFLYWKIPAFKDTTDFDHIKFHYTKSHKAINPLGITPFGPVPNIQPLE